MMLSRLVSFVAAVSSTALLVQAGSSQCSQASAEGSAPSSLQYKYNSRLSPFYQFINNNGYCAEVSLIQSMLGFGAWTSQANARALASTFTRYPQTGQSSGNHFMAQMLLDDSSPPGCRGCNSFGDAATKAKLVRKSYNSYSQSYGSQGVKEFLGWLKKEVLAGNVVVLGVATEDQETLTHIVTVLAIESNRPLSDTNYYDDDVIYFDDHGLATLRSASLNSASNGNPAIPPGVNDNKCTPYKFGYTFANFAGRIGSSNRRYRLPLPGSASDSKSFAYSISGVRDDDRQAVPVRLTITSNGFPRDQYAGYNYENPAIREGSNSGPSAQTMTLAVEVRNLTPGTQYNLYLYRSDGNSRAAFDNVPTSQFNKNAGKATTTIKFTATADTYSNSITIPSTSTILYRCVPASAP